MKLEMSVQNGFLLPDLYTKALPSTYILSLSKAINLRRNIIYVTVKFHTYMVLAVSNAVLHF